MEFFTNLWDTVSKFFIDLWNFNPVYLYVLGGLAFLFLFFFILFICASAKKRKFKKKYKESEEAANKAASDRIAQTESIKISLDAKNREMDALNKLNAESEERIAGLENDLKEKIEEVNTLKAKTVELEKENNDSEEAIETAKEEAKKAQDEILSLTALISSKDEASAEAEKNYNELLEAKNTLEADYNTLNEKNAALIKKHDELKAANAKVISEKEEISLENKVLLKAMGIIYNDALDDKKAVVKKIKKSEVKETVETAANEVLNRKELYEQAKRAGIKNYILMTNDKISSEVKKAEKENK